MRFQSFVIIIGLIVSISGGMAMAQQNAEVQQNADNQDQQMSPAFGPGALESDSKKILIQSLNLNRFEAAVGDLSACTGDQDCLNEADGIRSLLCVTNACGGSKEPTTCFPGFFDNYTVQAKAQAADAICACVRSPTPEKLKAVMAQIPNAKQEDAVEEEAYILALKGSAQSCQDTIKNYVGAYGPNWNKKWYRDLSGCRILARESTREQEEKDFSTWFGVAQGVGKCEDINNTELKDACNAPGATSPVSAVYEKW